MPAKGATQKKSIKYKIANIISIKFSEVLFSDKQVIYDNQPKKTDLPYLRKQKKFLQMENVSQLLWK